MQGEAQRLVVWKAACLTLTDELCPDNHGNFEKIFSLRGGDVRRAVVAITPWSSPNSGGGAIPRNGGTASCGAYSGNGDVPTGADHAPTVSVVIALCARPSAPFSRAGQCRKA